MSACKAFCVTVAIMTLATLGTSLIIGCCDCFQSDEQRLAAIQANEEAVAAQKEAEQANAMKRKQEEAAQLKEQRQSIVNYVANDTVYYMDPQTRHCFALYLRTTVHGSPTQTCVPCETIPEEILFTAVINSDDQ